MSLNFRGRECAQLRERLSRLVWYENGVFRCSDEAAAQAIIDAFTLADAAAELKGDVDRHAKMLRDRAVAHVSVGELSAWSIKRAEAAAFASSGNAADAPLLNAEAQAAGITLAALVARVQTNVTHFAGLEAQIGGQRRRHRDSIDAIATFAALRAYDISTGWPAV